MNKITIDVNSVKQFAKAKRKLLNILLSLSNKHLIVYPTQQWLADKVGCTPQWISELTTALHSEGWITKLYRHMTSCVYTPSSFLFDFYTRQSLKHILPALAWIPLSVGMLAASKFSKSLNDIYRNISNSSFEENSPEKVMTVVVKRIAEKYGMNGYQQEQLASYPDSMVLEADRIVSKATATDPVAYLFGICRKKTAQPISFKSHNRTTETVFNNVSDNNNRKSITQTTQSPSHKPWVSQELPPDERKEKRLRGLEKNRKQREYIASVYGQSSQQIRKENGMIALSQILGDLIEPVIQAEEVASEDWWPTQEPIDIEDYYQI